MKQLGLSPDNGDNVIDRSVRIALALDFIIGEESKGDGKWLNPFNIGGSSAERPKSVSVNADDVKKFIEKYGENPLFVWRFLPEAHPKVLEATVVPMYNHSFYDLLFLSLAIGNILKDGDKPAFLLFTLGPVQRFISTARKTSDLWAGSYLLSYLTWTAIRYVVETWGPENVVFPNLLRQPLMDLYLENSLGNLLGEKVGDKTAKEILQENTGLDRVTIANMPNRLFAIVPYGEATSDKEKGEWERRVKDEIVRIGRETLRQIEDKLSEQPGWDKSVWDKCQVQEKLMEALLNHFQTFWVVVPWWGDGNEENIDDIMEDYRQLVVNGSDNGQNPNKNHHNSESSKSTYETIQEVINVLKRIRKKPNVGYAYPLLYEATERFLAARKSVRDFEDVVSSAEHKCSLCGEYDPLPLGDGWAELPKGWVSHDGQRTERLCGVCMTKRLFPITFGSIVGVEVLGEEIKYPSTSEMAATLYKARIPDENARRIKESLKKTIKTEELEKATSVPKLKAHPLSNIDGQWFVKETYREDYVKNAYNWEREGLTPPTQGELDALWEEIRDLLRKAQNKKRHDEVEPPPTYYAILMMDGDNMGRWLGGEYMGYVEDFLSEPLKEKLRKDKDLSSILHSRHPMTPALHGTFSRLLGEFALDEVRCRVENNYGALIYAGGDDVLALLPAKMALKTARELREAYRDTLSKRADMSGGLVFVHHKYPLSLALEEVRDAEKKAKRLYNRGSLYIKFIKRSGEVREMGIKWRYLEEFEKLVCDYAHDKITKRFGYELGRLFNELFLTEREKDEDQKELDKELKKVIRGEFKRLLGRKQKVDADVLKRAKRFLDIYAKLDRDECKDKHENECEEERSHHRHLPNVFIIASLIATESEGGKS